MPQKTSLLKSQKNAFGVDIESIKSMHFDFFRKKSKQGEFYTLQLICSDDDKMTTIATKVYCSVAAAAKIQKLASNSSHAELVRYLKESNKIAYNKMANLIQEAHRLQNSNKGQEVRDSDYDSDDTRILGQGPHDDVLDRDVDDTFTHKLTGLKELMELAEESRRNAAAAAAP